MADNIGLGSDLKIYNDQFASGLWEGMSEVFEGFNQASRNTIRLETVGSPGDYRYKSFFKSDVTIARRDITAVTAVDKVPVTQDENISVKINRRTDPISHTLDGWKKISSDSREMSFILGEQLGPKRQEDMLKTALIAVAAAIEARSYEYDATGQSTKTLTHTHMVEGMALMGDFAMRLLMWAGYSKPTFDLMKQAISDNVFEIGGGVIKTGTSESFNKPWLHIDAPALTDANGSLIDTYNTLCLVEDAVIVEESEEITAAFEGPITGFENIMYTFQAEWAYNISVAGHKWDVANGGANPTDAALGTTTNWDLAASSAKLGPGISVKSQ